MAARKLTLGDILVFLLTLFGLYLGIVGFSDGRLFVGVFWTIASIIVAVQKYRNIKGKNPQDTIGKKLTTTENVMTTIFLVPVLFVLLGVTFIFCQSIKQPIDAVFPIITGTLSAAVGIVIYRNWKRGY
jgi:hypothetical protein